VPPFLIIFFLYFEFILKTNNITIDSTRKISYCKINVLKVERVQNTFENFKFFLNDVENAKNDANISRMNFFGFSLFFCYFFFENLSKT